LKPFTGQMLIDIKEEIINILERKVEVVDSQLIRGIDGDR